MADTRDRIRAHVHETPGVHFSRLERDLGLATGQIQYHLRKLTRADDVVSVEIAGRTHYFEPTFDPWERRAIAFLRRESARGIIVRLHANGPQKPTTLADELELARSTISWHASILVEHDIVEKSGKNPVRLELTRPEHTGDLLEAVSPSLPNRIVDRFIRSVDRLFDRHAPPSEGG